MRIPRDVDCLELAKSLEAFDYHITRQTGSHVRLTTTRGGEHHITIPRHRPLKVGTLSSILKDVAEHLKVSKEELTRKLWRG
jgi:predicted RNA binding protein YcfA (HicA-like mRNA interferase family)